MLATIINVITVIIGGTIGTLFGNKIKPEFSRGIIIVMGFITACIGVQSAAGTKSFLVVVLSLAVGTMIGMLLKLDDRINGAGDWAKQKLAKTPLGKGPFGDALITCFMLFCVGSMTILGSIHAGLDHDYSILLTKSIMDLISSMAFASALGAGVIFAAVPLFLFQGALTYRDQRLEGFDCACVVEVVEHMDPDRLPAFARTVFLHAAPKTVILTTPNRNYNKNYEALTEGKLRHPDHRFEWSKEEFTAWAEAVCKDYGYTVRLSWIGETDADGQQPTQMGVFTKCG